MSLRFVLYLARRLEDLPAVVLVAARPLPEPNDAPLLAELIAVPGLELVRPAPLGKPQVAQVIEARGFDAADAKFVAACYQASGGNPFLLGELLSSLVAAGASGSPQDAAGVATLTPERVVQWVRARLRALGEEAERLAGALAVLGEDATLSDAITLAGVAPSAASGVADALIKAEILTARSRYEFAHPLVHAAVLQGVGRARRAEAHGRAARLVADRGAPLARVAAHLLASDPGADAWVVDVLRAAAREATASGAPRSAVLYLERALEEAQGPSSRRELLLELGIAQHRAGLPGATQRMREALAVCSDARGRAEISLVLGRALLSGGDAEASEAFRRGLAELPDGADDELALELRGWYVTASHSGEASSAAPEGRVLVSLAGDGPGRSRSERFLLAHLAFRSGLSGKRSHEEVAKLAVRALADGALLAESGGDVGSHAAACYALLFAGQPRLALAELDRSIEWAQRHGAQLAFGSLSLVRAVAHYARGALVDALADLASAGNTLGGEYSRGVPAVRGWLALCLLERDDLDAAGAAVALPGDQLPLAVQGTQISYVYALARVEAAREQLVEGLDTLLECGTVAQELGAVNPAATLCWRSEAALLAARIGDQERARLLIEEELRLARAFGAPHALGIALRAGGLIVGGDHGLERLEEAVAVLDGSGIDLELARALAERGAALRRAGHRRDAREPLRRALDLATQSGALRLARRVRDELLAAGARPRRTRIAGADALTASERRVAQLAANGLSNREIAQALFVSLPTVVTHLGHCYQKLDINSRQQLRSALTPAPTDHG
jgi:DNA-binding CsgD family transcriptional regulator